MSAFVAYLYSIRVFLCATCIAWGQISQASSYPFERVSPLALSQDGVLYFYADESLYAVNNNGNMKWNFTAEGPVWFTLEAPPPVIDENGTVYFGSGDGSVNAVGPDGKKLWNVTRACHDAVGRSTTIAPIVTGGQSGAIYVNDCTGLYKFSMHGQTQLVNITIGGVPVLAADGSVYEIPGLAYPFNDRWLTRLDAAGEEMWKFRIRESIHQMSTITPNSDGTMVYHTNYDDGAITALYRNGTVRWQNSGIGVFSYGTVIGPNGSLYVYSSDDAAFQTVSAVDVECGAVKWTFGRHDTESAVLHPAVVGGDGVVYLVTGAGIAAISSDGRSLWNFTVPEGQKTLPVVGRDQVLYLLAGNFSKVMVLYAVQTNGKQKWKSFIENTQGMWMSIPPLVTEDGTVYVTTSSAVWAVSRGGSPKWNFRFRSKEQSHAAFV